jgi:hypothetical protein
MMLHNHNHNHLPVICSHNTRLCKQCDIVFCSKCGKEWEPKTNYTFTTTYGGFGVSPLSGTTYTVHKHS